METKKLLMSTSWEHEREPLEVESKALGYGLNEGKTSAGRYTFEINGVSDKDIKEFSQRRNNIMEAGI